MNQTDIRTKLTEFFGIEEIRTLCFDLNIDHEQLPSQSKEALVRELVIYCQRRGRLDALIEECRKARPQLEWPSAENVSKTELTLLIDRDFEGFTPDDEENFIFALSRIAKVKPSQIRILRVMRGSVIITLEMPEDGAQILMSKYLQGDPSLKALHITKVEVKQGLPETSNYPSSILFLSADPTDASRLRLGVEIREIQEKLQLARLREKFKLNQRMSVRPVDTSQALLDIQPQIVHFSGHGTPSGDLCFENQLGEAQPIEPDALAALFEQFSDRVNCVILNACYSVVQANAIVKHINYVIGMNHAIGDKAAIAFSIGFYQALGAGRSIEDAYKLGCVQIRLQGIPEHLIPVLLKKES